MNYLEYDAMFKIRCAECGLMDKLKGKNKALFGRSFPENSGVLMNKIKHMKAKYLNKEKPNYDSRDIALLYALNEGFKKGDHDIDEDGYSAFGEKPTAPTHLTDFDTKAEIAALWRTIPADVKNLEVFTRFMKTHGVDPSYESTSDTKSALASWKNRQKRYFSEVMAGMEFKDKYALHDDIDSYFAFSYPGFSKEELNKDRPGLEEYAYGTNEPPEIKEDI